MEILTASIERISFEQATQLKDMGVETELSKIISEIYPYSLNGLKQVCPYTLTTGIRDGKAFATTRKNSPEHYLYAETELEAAFNLIVSHLKKKVFSYRDCNMKMVLWKPEVIGAKSTIY